MKNNIRNNISRDNIYNPKRVNIEILEGMEFVSSYIIYNKISEIKLSNDILEEISKRSSKACIIFLENDISEKVSVIPIIDNNETTNNETTNNETTNNE